MKPLKKFENKIQLGTRVQITGREGWHPVVEFANERRLVKVQGVGGFFQRGHISKYSNKQGEGT